jgi:acetyltransferase-like isoleucine patch superfamily enzyme
VPEESETDMRPDGAIHPSAIVHPESRLGQNVEIGPFTCIGPGVTIGSGSRIEGWCEIGRTSGPAQPLALGEGCLVRSHSILYGGSSFGDSLKTGHHITVLPGARVGTGVQLGSYADVQGPCEIGDYVSFQSSVFVAPGTVIGDFCWVYMNAVLTNDRTPPSTITRGVTLEEAAVIGAGSIVLPGRRVGRGAVVAAGSLVGRDVAPGMLVAGNPAVEKGPVTAIGLRDGTGRAAYPWQGHYRAKYPAAVTADWPEARILEVEDAARRRGAG